MLNEAETVPTLHAGFTLVELVVVIVIIGVLSSFAMPRFFGTSAFSERGYYEELVTALKFARSAAVATGCPVRFVIGATDYSATQQQPAGGRCNPADTTWSQPVLLTDGSSVSGTAPDGISASPSQTIVFDALGATGLGANQVIAVGPYSLTVHAASGYVEST